MAKNPRLIDMAGQRFGHLVVKRQVGNAPGGGAYWLSDCDCGGSSRATGGDLRAGKVASCGCMQRKHAAKNLLTHGGTNTRVHRIWKSMRSRCNNPNLPGYNIYGARGIRICEEWDNFAVFRDWAHANGYDDTKSIDRIDNNGGYSPQNCRWASAQEQSENRRFVAKNSDGRLWWHIALENGLTQGAYRSRLNAGWPIEKAATLPLGSRLK